MYLKEEIKEEALVRNLNDFQRFLEVAALTDGEIVNNANIAQDCGVRATSVNAYKYYLYLCQKILILDLELVK